MRRLGLSAALLALAAPALADPPALRKQGSATQLVVQGKPFLVIGGELGNSSASSEAYMAPHWARLRAMHLNTVLAPVSWELIEPVEGKFDWSSLDWMLRDARANDLKLVILWFGAWKNSMSTYAPSWVKRDQRRFQRATGMDGHGVDILSAHGPATLEADKRAFAAMLAHIREMDGAQNTVLMVQVENEMGMLPTARDHGVLANAAFAKPVPAELTGYLTRNRATLVPALRALWEANGARTQGSWADLFGSGDAGEEIFTAWHYARFAGALAQAGKAAYPVPHFVNVALNRPGRTPGQYPSGGPLPHLIDIWKAAAPQIDLLAPDIYFPSFLDITGAYHRPDNPLFLPEAHNAGQSTGPANAFFAIGAHDAIGFSPFSIESIDTAPGTLGSAYGVLAQLQPLILGAQGTGRMTGFKPRQDYDGSVHLDPETRTLGPYRFTISYDADKGADSGGLIIQTGPEEYLVAGQGITVTFAPVASGSAGIDLAEEGNFANGSWSAGRRLNGDQTHQGRHLRFWPGQWQIQRLRLYRIE